MSLKIKKHIILAFLVLLMFIIIPMSFASDVNDDGCMEISVDDSKSMDNVISISEESETVLNMENDFANSQNETLLGADEYSGIIYVSKSGNDNNDGSEGSPVATIKKGISLATSASNVEHKIIIGEGTYKENSISISSDLTIVGNNAVIQASPSTFSYHNILEITGGTVSVSGVTLTNIKIPLIGNDFHAIKISNAAVTINNCIFDTNTAKEGPAIYINNAGTNNIINITNNLFKKQTANTRGVIYSSNSKIYLANNTMVDSSASNIYANNGEILSQLNLDMGQNSTIYLGDNINIEAKLTDDNGNAIDGGKITFTANEQSIGEASVSSGTASAKFTPEAAENYTISGAYNLGSNINVKTALITVNELTYNGTIYVSKNGNDKNDGSQETPVLTISKAIELATSENNTDHKIVIGEGTYEENSLSISSDLTIVGNNAIIDGSSRGNNLFDITGGNVNINGVTFANVQTGLISLTDYHAIKISNAAVAIDNCIFDTNTARDGPAIYINNAGTNNIINITNNLFKKQTVRSEGVIYSSNSKIYLANNTLVDCSSSDIYISGGEILSQLNLDMGQNSTIYLGDNVNIEAKLTDDNGNTIDGGKITFTANEQSIGEASVSSGTASTKFTPEAVENYTISGAYNLGSNINVKTALITVKKLSYNGTIYVSKDGNDKNDGSQETPVLTIAKAIELATSENNTDHKIVIGEGTYVERNLPISSDLTIVGNNAIIDASPDLLNYYDLLIISGGNVSISGVTFANVNTNFLDLLYDHHAIIISNAAVAIDNCIFDSNTGKEGPAIYITDAGADNIINITNNLFKKQTARNDGVIYSSNSKIYLANNTMVDSSASNIYANNGEILSQLNLDMGENSTIYLGESANIEAKLTDDNGNAIYGGRITFTANEERIGESSISSGTASITFTPETVENYTISGTYNLGSNVNVKTALITVEKLNYNGTIYVSKNGNDRNEGSQNRPVLTIARAIELATSENNTDHKIIIDNGTYEENSLSISSDLTIVGNNTIIDATHSSKNILTISGSNVNVSGITFANVETNVLTLTDYHAIAIENANAVIDNCVFENNSAYYGPAIHISDAGAENTIVISNNLFKKQSARFNGIIYSSNSMIDLSNNTMVDCSSLLGNSGIYITGGEILSEVNLTIEKNTTIRLGEKVTINAVLTDDNGNIITGGEITFTANEQTIGKSSVSGGTASIDFTPEAIDNYTISGTYDLASNVNVETALITVNEPYTGIIYVSKNGNDTNEGSQDSPVLTIAKAIEIATYKGNLYHMIIIDDGTYKEKNLAVGSDLTIIGNNTVISETDNILDITGGNVFVSGITFTNVLELINVGAIKIQNANATIDNCVFENNTAATGAAIYVSNSGDGNTVTITNNMFKKQTSLSMGIIYATNSTIYLENNTLEDCSSYLLGSDIYISSGKIISEVNLDIGGDATIYLGETVRITAKLSDDNGNSIVGGKIKFTANGEEINEVYVLNNDVSTDFTPQVLANYTISGEYSLASNVNVDTALIQMKEYTGTIYVSKRGSDNNCGNEQLPVLTIAKAIELATSENNTDHKIIIREGTYRESRLPIDSDLTIIGNNAIIDAFYVGKVLDITGGNVSLSGITFTNVLAVLNVGAISIQNANVLIDNCAFENNTALRAPAIYVSNVNEDNTVVITNNKFTRQTALLRGIIYSTDSTIYLENNTMEDCSSYILGSDIYLDGGEITSKVNLVIGENATIELGDQATINAALTDDKGNSISGGRITLTANKETIGEYNVLDGDISTTFTPEAIGNYLISGTYNLADNVNVETALIIVEKYTGIIYVSKQGNDKNNGSQNMPVLTIKRAIELATYEGNLYHTIIIDNGTYNERNLAINSDLTIIGNNTIIDASYVGKVLDITGGNVNVTGITFTNVLAALNVGAISIQNASAIIDNCVFENNTALRAPAIYVSNVNEDNTVVITNNKFTRQTALLRGIIYSTNSTIYLENNTMEDCSSYILGSDIYLDGGEITSKVNLVIGENATIELGDQATINAALTDDKGNSISGGRITLTANKETIGEYNLQDGSISTTFTPEAIGSYLISGTYNLADNVNVETALITVEKYTGIIYVSKQGNDKNNGSQNMPVLTIKRAIELATYEGNLYHTIIIDNGTYNEDNLVIDSKLTIFGDNTIISGNDNILDIRGGDVYLFDITFSNVNEILNVGAIKIDNASAVIDNCVFENNTALTAPAIYITNTGNNSVTIINNKFKNQVAIYRGIIYSSNSSIYLSNNSIENSGSYLSGCDIYVNGGEILSEVNLIIERNRTILIGRSATVTASLTDDRGNTIVGGKLNLTANDIIFSEVDVSNTRVNAEFSPEPVVANYTISGVYDLATNVNVQTAFIQVIDFTLIFVNDVTKYYGGPEEIVVLLINSLLQPAVNKTVSVTVDGVTYNEKTDERGIARFNISLNSGEYEVTTTVDERSVNSTITVLTTINATDIESEFRNVTYSATLLDTEGNYVENGTIVEFSIDDVIYVGEVIGEEGLAVVDLILNSGEYVITVTNPVTGEEHANNITVNAKDPGISIDADEITEGEPAVINVTLDSNATGTVTATVDGVDYTVDVVDGTATIIIPDLAKGNYTVPVKYSGDNVYNPTQDNVTVVVNPKPKENATISIDAPTEATEGDNITVTVTLPEDATGTVTIGNEVVPIVDGVATAVLTNIPAGNTTIPITYSGDDKYNPIETNVTVDVKKAKENATISIDAPTEATEGDNITVTVTLPEDATGTVTIGNEVVPIVDGVATAVLTNIPAGNTTIPITYSGDDKYNPIETNVTVNVKEDTSIVVSAPDVTKYYHGSERFVVTVTDSKGNPLAGKSATIVINGVSYSRKTNANGTTTVALSIPSGVYNVTTTVDNTTINSVVTILTTVNGTDLVKVFRNATQYYATFRDSEGNYLAEGTEVQFNINGVLYTRKVTTNGLAKLNINLEQGEYIITATNLVTGEMSSNNITVIPRIVENYDLIKYYRNATQYTAKIIGDDGNPAGAGEIVTFNIHGVMYTRTTDASGIVKLNINLEPGDYIITAEYKECKVSNNIKVLPTLTGKDITMKYRDGTPYVATLVDGQGKPYAEQTIQFNINGVFYNRVTDSKGQAKLNINLMPGEYIVTSTYNTASISNKITILG